MLDAGAAYRCFCTAERLADLRREQMGDGSGYLGYDGLCCGLSEQEVADKEAAGEPVAPPLISRSPHDLKLR